jgi:hypothetical protein
MSTYEEGWRRYETHGWSENQIPEHGLLTPSTDAWS